MSLTSPALAGRFFTTSATWEASLYIPMGFPGVSDSEESAGDLCSIPGSGRSPGEGIGHPLQYSWTSLPAQLVKNLPAMQETLVREDPLEKGNATHSSILAWRIPRSPWCRKESNTTE